MISKLYLRAEVKTELNASCHQVVQLFDMGVCVSVCVCLTPVLLSLPTLWTNNVTFQSRVCNI